MYELWAVLQMFPIHFLQFLQLKHLIESIWNTYNMNHPGLSKIPAPAGGPGSDIINLGITLEGQKLGAGRFLRQDGGSRCLPKFASAFNTYNGSKCRVYCVK